MMNMPKLLRDYADKLDRQGGIMMAGDPNSLIAVSGGKGGSKRTQGRPELEKLLRRANKAMDGDSNDAEHDALFELVQYLENEATQ